MDFSATSDFGYPGNNLKTDNINLKTKTSVCRTVRYSYCRKFVAARSALRVRYSGSGMSTCTAVYSDDTQQTKK
eukprot:scaffold539692_cov22-Prasinocladus_malaysianus.AAC.1